MQSSARALEERLRYSEARLRSIFENVPVGVILTDSQGNYVEVNEAQCRLFRMSREELLRQNYFNQKDQSLQSLYRRATAGDSVEYEGWYADADKGLTRWLRTTFAPVIDSDGKVSGVIILNEDKTEKKELEEQLFEQSRLAFIGATAAMVGHDLRNPLQAIVNTLYILKRRLLSTTVAETERQALEKIVGSFEEQVDYMNKIVSDLQDYARPVKLELVETDAKELFDDVLSAITIPENVEVLTAIEEHTPKIMADRAHIKRVLVNLVTNSIQAMPGGGLLSIKASRTDEAVLMRVQDTGLGIPKENMDKLFQPLFTTKAKGQGLGLAICNRIIGAHGGEIIVDSEVDKGTIFTIRMPFSTEVS